jgi:hypothetical protein
MNETEAVRARGDMVTARTEARDKPGSAYVERRRSPRPPLAEIRRGGKLNLLPPIVVSGSVRTVEFLIVAVLGFAIYLAYVEHESESAHIIYLGAVLIAATANTLICQALNLYQMTAFSAFVRSFARIVFAWTVVVAGMMSLAFFVKVGAEFSRVWIATWYGTALLALFGERLVLSAVGPRPRSSSRHWKLPPTPTSALSASSTIVVPIGSRRSSQATPSSAISMSWSNSRAPRASISSSCRSRSRRRNVCSNS